MEFRQKEIKILLGALAAILLGVVMVSLFTGQRGEADAQRQAVEEALENQIAMMDSDIEEAFLRDMEVASLEIITQTSDELEVEVMIEMFDVLKFIEEIHLLLIEGDFWNADHLVNEIQIAWDKALLSTETTRKGMDRPLHLQKNDRDQWVVSNPEVFTFSFPEKNSFSTQTARNLSGFQEAYTRPFEGFSPRFSLVQMDEIIEDFHQELIRGIEEFQNRRIDLNRIGSRREIRFIVEEPDLEEFWSRFFELSRASIQEHGYRQDSLIQAFQRAKEITGRHERPVMDIEIIEERREDGAIGYSTEVMYNDKTLDTFQLLSEFRLLKEVLPTMPGEYGKHRVNLNSNVFTDRALDFLSTEEIRAVHHFSLENERIYLMEDDGKILRFRFADIEEGDWIKSITLAVAPDDEGLMVGNPQMVIDDDLIIIQYLFQTERLELEHHLNVLKIHDEGVEELYRTENYPMDGQSFWFSYNENPYALISYHHEIVRDLGIGPNKGGIVEGEVILYDLLNDEVLYRLSTEDFTEEGRIKFSKTNDRQSIVFFYDQQSLLFGEEDEISREAGEDQVHHFIEVYSLEEKGVVLTSENVYPGDQITYGAVPVGDYHMVLLTMDEGWHLWNLAEGAGGIIPGSEQDRFEHDDSLSREVVRDLKEVEDGLMEAWVVSELSGGVKEYWHFNGNELFLLDSFEKSPESDLRFHPLSRTMTLVKTDNDLSVVEVHRIGDNLNEGLALEKVKTYVTPEVHPVFLAGQYELYNGIQVDLSERGHGVLAKGGQEIHDNLFYLFQFIRAEEAIGTELGGFLRLEVTEDLEKVVVVYNDGIRIYQLGELFRRIEGFFR